MKKFSKKFIDHNILSFNKEDWHKHKESKQKRIQHSNQCLTIDARTHITIFVNHFGSLFAPPTQAAGAFFKMGTKLEDVMT
jgi:hypothetical protein